MATSDGGGKQRRSSPIRQMVSPVARTLQHQQPDSDSEFGNIPANISETSSVELTSSAAYPCLNRAAWSLFGEALFAAGASQEFLQSMGLTSNALERVEEDVDTTQEERTDGAIALPSTVTDAAGYVFTVEGNGGAFALTSIPEGAPGSLGARITPHGAGWEELTTRWLDGATPVTAAPIDQGTAAAAVVEADPTIDTEATQGWLDWGVDSLSRAASSANEIDRAVNPARWAADALGEHMANATNQAWDTVGRGVGQASEWWANEKGNGEGTETETEADLSMEDRFAEHQASQGMLNTAVSKSRQTTNYTTGDAWLQTDAEGMLKRKMTSAEQEALFSGRDGADDFVCSTFVIWTFLASQRASLPATMSDEEKDDELTKLLRAEIDTSYEGDAARGGHYGHEFTWDKKKDGKTRETTENLTFLGVANTQLEIFKRGRDGTSEVADDHIEDAFDDSQAAAGFTNDDLRVMGMAGALVLMGMADRVLDLNELRPGDVMQSRAKSLGGHATMVHRVWCQGSGYFGPSPWFPKLLANELDLSSVDPESGVWLDDVAYYIDECTMPEFVGTYTQTAIDHIGAHNAGVESALSQADGEQPSSASRAGVYSRTDEGAASEHNSKSKRLYAGRLHSSPWQLPHTPATSPVEEDPPASGTTAPGEASSSNGGWGLW